MGDVLIEDLVDGWETLLVAAWYPDDQVQSLLRLNKQLASLQRVGFPAPVRFNNIDKGPASLDVGKRANTAADAGMLEHKQTDMGPDKDPREEWHLTEKGRDYIRSEVMRAIKNHPRGDQYLQNFHNEMRRIGFARNPDLVAEAHNVLHLDEDAEFLEHYAKTLNTLEGWLQRFEENPPRAEMELVAGAATELGVEALYAIEDNLLSNSTGKHHVVWNCEQLLGALADVDSADQMEGPMESDLQRDFERALNALEVNSEIYGYLDIPSEEELDELFWSAEPSTPEDLIA